MMSRDTKPHSAMPMYRTAGESGGGWQHSAKASCFERRQPVGRRRQGAFCAQASRAWLLLVAPSVKLTPAASPEVPVAGGRLLLHYHHHRRLLLVAHGPRGRPHRRPVVGKLPVLQGTAREAGRGGRKAAAGATAAAAASGQAAGCCWCLQCSC